MTVNVVLPTFFGVALHETSVAAWLTDTTDSSALFHVTDTSLASDGVIVYMSDVRRRGLSPTHSVWLRYCSSIVMPVTETVTFSDIDAPALLLSTEATFNTHSPPPTAVTDHTPLLSDTVATVLSELVQRTLLS